MHAKLYTITAMSARSRNPTSKGSLRSGFPSPAVFRSLGITVQQLAGLLGRQHRRLAFFHDVFGTAHGVGGIHINDVADHQLVRTACGARPGVP
jgi:hypothetical protein